MKNFLALFLVLLIVTMPVLPQSASNTVTKFNAKETDGLYKVEVEFTADSVGSFVTKTFQVPKYDLVYTAESNPIIFRTKTVSTYGTPAITIFLQGVYYTETDTASLDTIRYQVGNQGEVDTMGVLTMNSRYAPGYKIFFRNAGGDVNSGKLLLYFPVKQKYFR